MALKFLAFVVIVYLIGFVFIKNIQYKNVLGSVTHKM